MGKLKYNSDKHIYNTIMLALNNNHFIQSNNIDTSFMKETIEAISTRLFNFNAINHIEIYAKDLVQPTNAYLNQLTPNKDNRQILEALKSIDTIIYDYTTMLSMTKKEIEDDIYYSKYLERITEKIKINNEYKSTSYEIEKFIFEKLNDKKGIYKLFNSNKELLYIGYTSNFKNIILSMANKMEASYFSYAILENYFDMQIYTLYYVGKLKPQRNTLSDVNESPTVKLEELNFSELKYLF